MAWAHTGEVVARAATAAAQGARRAGDGLRAAIAVTGRVLNDARRFAIEEIRTHYQVLWVEWTGLDDLEEGGHPLQPPVNEQEQWWKWFWKRAGSLILGLIFSAALGGVWMGLKNTGKALKTTTVNSARALFIPHGDYLHPHLAWQRHIFGLPGHVLGLIAAGVMLPFSILWNTTISTLYGFVRGWNIAVEGGKSTQSQLTPAAETITEGVQKFFLGGLGQLAAVGTVFIAAAFTTAVRIAVNTLTLTGKAIPKIWNGVAPSDWEYHPDTKNSTAETVDSGTEATPSNGANQEVDANVVHRGVAKVLAFILSLIPAVVIGVPVIVLRLVTNTIKEIANAAVGMWDFTASDETKKNRTLRDDGTFIEETVPVYQSGLKPGHFSSDNPVYKWTGRVLGTLTGFTILAGALSFAAVFTVRTLSNIAKEFGNGVLAAWNATVSDKQTKKNDAGEMDYDYRTPKANGWRPLSSADPTYQSLGILVGWPLSLVVGAPLAAVVTGVRVLIEIGRGIAFAAVQAWNNVLKVGKPQPAYPEKSSSLIEPLLADNTDTSALLEEKARPSAQAESTPVLPVGEAIQPAKKKKDFLEIEYSDYPGKGLWTKPGWKNDNAPQRLNPLVDGVGGLIGGVIGVGVGVVTGLLAFVVRAGENFGRGVGTAFTETFPLALYANDQTWWKERSPNPPGWNTYFLASAVGMLVGGIVGGFCTGCIAGGRVLGNGGKHFANEFLKNFRYALSQKKFQKFEHYFEPTNDWAGENNRYNRACAWLGKGVGNVFCGLALIAGGLPYIGSAAKRTFKHSIKAAAGTTTQDESLSKALLGSDEPVPRSQMVAAAPVGEPALGGASSVAPSIAVDDQWFAKRNKTYRKVGAAIGGFFAFLGAAIPVALTVAWRALINFAHGIGITAFVDGPAAAWTGEPNEDSDWYTAPEKQLGFGYKACYYMGQGVGSYPGLAFGAIVATLRGLGHAGFGFFGAIGLLINRSNYEGKAPVPAPASALIQAEAAALTPATLRIHDARVEGGSVTPAEAPKPIPPFFDDPEETLGRPYKAIFRVSQGVGYAVGAVFAVAYHLGVSLVKTFRQTMKLAAGTVKPGDSLSEALVRTDDLPTATAQAANSQLKALAIERKVLRGIGGVVGGTLAGVLAAVPAAVIVLGRLAGNFFEGLLKTIFVEAPLTAWKGEEQLQPKEEALGFGYRLSYGIGQAVGFFPGAGTGLAVAALKAAGHAALGAWDAIELLTLRSTAIPIPAGKNRFSDPKSEIGAVYKGAYRISQAVGSVVSIAPMLLVAAVRFVFLHFCRGIYEQSKTMTEYALGKDTQIAPSDQSSGAIYRGGFRLGQLVGCVTGALCNVGVNFVRTCISIGKGATYVGGSIIRESLPSDMKSKKAFPQPDKDNYRAFGYVLGGVMGGIVGGLTSLLLSTTLSFAALAGASWNAAFSVKHFDTLKQDKRSIWGQSFGVAGYVAAAVTVVPLATVIRSVRRIPDILAIGISMGTAVVRGLGTIWGWIGKKLSPPPQRNPGEATSVHNALKDLRHSVDGSGSIPKGTVIGAKSDTKSRFARQAVRRFLAFNLDSFTEEVLKAYEKDYNDWRRTNLESALENFLAQNPGRGRYVGEVCQKATAEHWYDRPEEVNRRRIEVENVLILAKQYLQKKLAPSPLEEKPVTQSRDARSVPVALQALPVAEPKEEKQDSSQKYRVNIDTAPESAMSFWKVFIGEKMPSAVSAESATPI